MDDTAFQDEDCSPVDGLLWMLQENQGGKFNSYQELTFA